MDDAAFNLGTRSDPLGDPKGRLNPDLDALAAFVTRLNHFPRSPYRNRDGTLSPSAVRGKAIFMTLDCTHCHAGSAMIDSQLHDVGTLKGTSGRRSGQPLTGIDTQTLRGIWATAPYLHDGSARTLIEVISNSAHGNASGLSQSNKDDLVSYLNQIDDRD